MFPPKNRIDLDIEGKAVASAFTQSEAAEIVKAKELRMVVRSSIRYRF